MQRNNPPMNIKVQRKSLLSLRIGALLLILLSSHLSSSAQHSMEGVLEYEVPQDRLDQLLTSIMMGMNDVSLSGGKPMASLEDIKIYPAGFEINTMDLGYNDSTFSSLFNKQKINECEKNGEYICYSEEDVSQLWGSDKNIFGLNENGELVASYKAERAFTEVSELGFGDRNVVELEPIDSFGYSGGTAKAYIVTDLTKVDLDYPATPFKKKKLPDEKAKAILADYLRLYDTVTIDSAYRFETPISNYVLISLQVPQPGAPSSKIFLFEEQPDGLYEELSIKYKQENSINFSKLLLNDLSRMRDWWTPDRMYQFSLHDCILLPLSMKNFPLFLLDIDYSTEGSCDSGNEYILIQPANHPHPIDSLENLYKMLVEECQTCSPDKFQSRFNEELLDKFSNINLVQECASINQNLVERGLSSEDFTYREQVNFTRILNHALSILKNHTNQNQISFKYFLERDSSREKAVIQYVQKHFVGDTKKILVQKPLILDDFTAIEGIEESDDRFMEAFIDTLLFAAMTGFIAVILIWFRYKRRKKNEAEVAKNVPALDVWQKDYVEKQEDFSQKRKQYPPAKRSDVKGVNVETQTTPKAKNQVVGTNHSHSNGAKTSDNNNSKRSDSAKASDRSGEKAGNSDKKAVDGMVQSTEKKNEATPPPQKVPWKPFILYLKPANADGIFPEGESTLNYRYHIAKLTLSSEHAKQGAFEFLPSAQEKLVAQWTSYLAAIATIRPESNFYQPAGKLIDVVPGVLEKEGGRWKVKKKAVVTIK